MEENKRIQEEVSQAKQESNKEAPHGKEIDLFTNEQIKRIFSMRTFAEILIFAIMLIGLISASGGPTEQEYTRLKNAYDILEIELEETKESLDNKYTQYEKYQNKMSKFDELAEKGLSEDEVDALISKADEIIAENKAKKEAEEKAAQEAAAAEAAEEKVIASATLEQKNALKKAESYLDTMPFSKKGLIEQLEYEGYSKESATFAVNHCGADWNEQAAKKAEDYMDTMSFSKQGLIDQLEYEGFTKKQAQYGAKAVGY